MFGQAIKLPTPREPNPTEKLIWNRFDNLFNKTTKTISAFVSTVDVANRLQRWATVNDLPVEIFDEADQRVADSILNRYNTLGRIKSGAELNKYWAVFKEGDITICAPPGMPKEEYENDIFPYAMDPDVGLGIPVIPIVIGVALVVGCIITDQVIDYQARNRDLEFRNKVLEADQAMMKQSTDIRNSWSRAKRDSSDLIHKANQEHDESWFDDLLPSGFGIAGALIAIIGLLVAYQVTKK